MATVLIVSPYYPRPDQASGDVRLSTLLRLLARKHSVHFCALDDSGGSLPKNGYSLQLEKNGIKVEDTRFSETISNVKPNLIWFEFYYQARQDYLDLVRRRLPNSKILIDSVDIHFNRLFAQAALTKKEADLETAKETKEKELQAYSQADLVLAVTNDDAKLVSTYLPDTAVAVVPNVHEQRPYGNPSFRKRGELIFIGGFRHTPNEDAMLYFCQEIFPIVVKGYPSVRLKIIGSNPTPAILSLGTHNIDVLGYVADISNHLRDAYISVAPLRFGGGMKGKVGEAMSWGIPVVTTKFGAEGFGLEANKDALIGETPTEFANHVLSLINNPGLHSKISSNGYFFINNNYGIDAVSAKLDTCIELALQSPPKKKPRIQRIAGRLRDFYDHHVAWRLR